LENRKWKEKKGEEWKKWVITYFIEKELWKAKCSTGEVNLITDNQTGTAISLLVYSKEPRLVGILPASTVHASIKSVKIAH
jgi:hypothetical protein